MGSAPATQDARASVYKYALCNSCGWCVDEPFGDPPEAFLAQHVDRCEAPSRHLMVPMWSVAWPNYWGVQKGEIPADHFGLEMEWRVVGSHTTTHRTITTGMDPKEWFLFPPRTAAVGEERTP